MAERGVKHLVAALGREQGRHLRAPTSEHDDRPVQPQWDAKSIGHEETFPRDVSDREQLHAELRRMALSLAEHLTKDDRVARTVTTKLRYPDFSIRSRSRTSPVGSADAERIGEAACALLDRALADRPGALRLVGVSVSNIEPHQQLVLG